MMVRPRSRFFYWSQEVDGLESGEAIAEISTRKASGEWREYRIPHCFSADYEAVARLPGINAFELCPARVSRRLSTPPKPTTEGLLFSSFFFMTWQSYV